MADVFLTNQTPATGAIAMFNLKTQAKAAGWTVPFSGDGTSLFNSSDGITTGASGAGGMANSSAWYVIKWPGSGSKSICIQRGTTNLVWRVKYSFSAGFTLGSASATRVPAATDEKILLGGNTDAAPTFANFFNGTADAGYRHNLWFQSETPFAFYSVGWVNGGSSTGGIHNLSLDHMLSTSYQAGDTDPYVLMCSGGVSATGTDMTGGTNTATSIGGALAGSGGVKTAIFNSVAPISNSGLPPNPNTGKDEAVPLVWMCTTAPAGWKGWSDVFYYHLTGTASA